MDFKPGDLLLYELKHDRSGNHYDIDWLECVFIRYQGKHSARVSLVHGKVKEKTVFLHKLRKKL